MGKPALLCPPLLLPPAVLLLMLLLLLLLVFLEAAIEASSVMLTYVGWSCGCSLVMCGGIGDGHCRGTLGLAFLTDVVESGRSSEEQRTGSGGRQATLAGDFCVSAIVSGLWKVYTVRAGRWWPFS